MLKLGRQSVAISGNQWQSVAIVHVPEEGRNQRHHQRPSVVIRGDSRPVRVHDRVGRGKSQVALGRKAHVGDLARGRRRVARGLYVKRVRPGQRFVGRSAARAREWEIRAREWEIGAREWEIEAEALPAAILVAHTPDEGRNQMQSEVIRCNQRSSDAIRGHQRRDSHTPDEGRNQMHSEVIRCNQWSSDAIRGHQRRDSHTPMGQPSP
jgi:hypothetical protein